MHVTLVEINVKPDRIDDFLRVFTANHEGTIAEPGCVGQPHPTWIRCRACRLSC